MYEDLPAWARQTAQRLFEQQQALYNQRHEYVRVSSDDFPGLDRAFYEATQHWLEQRGFVWLGDIENRSFTRHLKGMPVFTRVLRSADGVITASFKHSRIGRWSQLWLRVQYWLGGLPQAKTECRLVSFASELNDGTFLSTSNAYELDTALDAVPGLFNQERPEDTALDELLAAHRALLHRRLDAHPEARPVPAFTLDDVNEATHRFQDRVNAHRQAVGYVTREQLIRAFGEEKGPEVDAALRYILDRESRSVAA